MAVASAVQVEASKAGALLPLERARAHHPTRPVQLAFRLFPGGCSLQRGPASCRLPGLALGRPSCSLLFWSGFLEKQRESAGLCSCCGALG